MMMMECLDRYNLASERSMTMGTALFDDGLDRMMFENRDLAA